MIVPVAVWSAAVLSAAGQPGPGPARRLLEHELDRPEYAGAHVSWWDRVSQAFLDWLSSLRFDGTGSGGVGRVVLALAVVVVLAVVVLVVVTRGLPRRRALALAAGAGVFDDGDDRRADELRRAARAALRAGDHTGAVLDGYRALARGLAERDLVTDVPGSTARTIAAAASGPFPQHADRLLRAATVFDGVRYLGAPADGDDARLVLDTDDAVAAARPVPTVPA